MLSVLVFEVITTAELSFDASSGILKLPACKLVQFSYYLSIV